VTMAEFHEACWAFAQRHCAVESYLPVLRCYVVEKGGAFEPQHELFARQVWDVVQRRKEADRARNREAVLAYAQPAQAFDVAAFCAAIEGKTGVVVWS
jgi:hypothetical protein